MQVETSKHYLVVGLGNPGIDYQDTRHNIGFEVVAAFAKKQQWTFRKDATFHGEFAKGTLEASNGEPGKKVIVLMPLTYMNNSGEAVLACVKYFHIPTQHILVVSDQIDLPFGRLKLTENGGAGGHNGLKSVQFCLNTQDYTHLRFGVGDREEGDLADHVLGKFPEEERQRLPTLIEQAVQVIHIWINQGSEPAMRACAPIDPKKS